MKKFTLFATLTAVGLLRLNAQQSTQQIIMPDQTATQAMPVMPQQPVTTPGQPITQGQPVTQGPPIMPQQPDTQGQPVQGQPVTQEVNAAPTHGLTLVHLNLVVLAQAMTSTNGQPPALHFAQSTLSDNDILELINEEFGTSFSTTNGDQLAVSNFLDGKFIVVGPTNNVLLSDASTTANNDHYHLNFSAANTVSATEQSTNATMIFTVADGSLNYISGDGTNSFRLTGLTMINDIFFTGSSNSTESFVLTGGSGSISFPDSSNAVSGVLTGNISGSGQNNAPAP